jgi:hypothetical protein
VKEVRVVDIAQALWNIEENEYKEWHTTIKVV